METIQVEERYRTGLLEIDQQHAGLFALHEELRSSLTAQHPPHHVIELMAQLYQQIRVHFETEEELMDELGFPGAKTHRAQHAGLTQRLRGIILEYRLSGDAITQDIISFLQDLIVTHIVREDLEIARHAGTLPDRGTPR